MNDEIGFPNYLSILPGPTLQVTMNHFEDTIHGWTDSNLHHVYRDAVAAAPADVPSTFIEVGSYLGKSASIMLVEIINSNKPIAFHCVDHFKGSPDESNHLDEAKAHGGSLRPAFDRNLQSVSHYAGFHVHQMESTEAAKLFEPGTVDFVFIDAQHTEEAVNADIVAWWPVVKPGGLLAGHDYGYESVERAVKKFFGERAPERKSGETCWGVRK